MVDIRFLHDTEDFNYDELFGDYSLDKNDSTGKSWDLGTRNLEADLSNFYFINKEKKLKLEDGNYIIPTFKYAENVDKYFYEYVSEKGNLNRSEMMTYVEFKYFLAGNGFIELN